MCVFWAKNEVSKLIWSHLAAKKAIWPLCSQYILSKYQVWHPCHLSYVYCPCYPWRHSVGGGQRSWDIQPTSHIHVYTVHCPHCHLPYVYCPHGLWRPSVGGVVGQRSWDIHPTSHIHVYTVHCPHGHLPYVYFPHGLWRPSVGGGGSGGLGTIFLSEPQNGCPAVTTRCSDHKWTCTKNHMNNESPRRNKAIPLPNLSKCRCRKKQKPCHCSTSQLPVPIMREEKGTSGFYEWDEISAENWAENKQKHKPSGFVRW